MKHPLLIAASAAWLTLSALTADGSDFTATTPEKAQVPQTAAAIHSAELISRAERALNDYIATCHSGRVAVDCATFGGRNGLVSKLWIFPTYDDTSVFVHFEVRASAGSTPQKQLALLEMSGERIARLVSFSAAPAETADPGNRS